MKVEEICRKHGISNATYYNWKSKYGGMEASDVKKLKELQDENAKLKRNPSGTRGQVSRTRGQVLNRA